MNPSTEEQKHSIKYSHVFKEDIDHVYACFTNHRILTEFIFHSSITELKTEKLWDSPNLIIHLKWNNRLNLTMQTREIIKTPSHKSFSVEFWEINRKQISFTNNYNFYENTCEQNTWFTFEMTTKSKYLFDTFNTEFPESEKDRLCLKIEEYLKTSLTLLPEYKSIEIGKPLLDSWNYFTLFKAILPTCFGKECEVEVSPEYWTVGSIISVHDKTSRKPVIKYKAMNIIMSEDRMQWVLEKTKDVKFRPEHCVMLLIEKWDEGSCFICIQHCYTEYVDLLYLSRVGKLKQKVLKLSKKKIEGM